MVLILYFSAGINWLARVGRYRPGRIAATSVPLFPLTAEMGQHGVNLLKDREFLRFFPERKTRNKSRSIWDGRKQRTTSRQGVPSRIANRDFLHVPRREIMQLPTCQRAVALQSYAGRVPDTVDMMAN
jgi:hypothetical protein